MEFARALIAAYLVATLTATALAKLKNWRTASLSVARESVIPSRAAPAVIIAVSATELLLAAWFTLGFQSELAGFTGMSLFLAFLGYQLLVAARTNSLMCSCAGATRADPASLSAVAGTTLACLVQASLSCALALIGSAIGVFHVFVIIVWIIPAILFFAGLLRRPDRPGKSHQISIWSPYRNYEIGELNDRGAKLQTVLTVRRRPGVVSTETPTVTGGQFTIH